MESLSVPASGRIYLDASAFIYSIERHPVFGPLLDPMWAALAASACANHHQRIDGPGELGLTFGGSKILGHFERAFDESGLQLLPASRSVMRLAAELRANHSSLRTPDAIHLATAEIYASQFIVTNDVRMRDKTVVPIVILSDLITSGS